MITKLKELIDSQKWADAFEKALILVANFSNIEYTCEDDRKKFADFFNKYIIDEYDCVLSANSGISLFRLNNNNITKNSLRNITLSGFKKSRSENWYHHTFNLAEIMYQCRCSTLHAGIRSLEKIQIDGKIAVFALNIDERNIFKQNSNNIYFCPNFFTLLILHSIESYINTMPTKTSDINNRYSEYLQKNTKSIIVTAYPLPSILATKTELNALLYLTVQADKSIVIKEDYFTVEYSDSLIKIFLYQVKDFESVPSDSSKAKVQTLKINFKEEIECFNGLNVDSEHPEISELGKKLRDV